MPAREDRIPELLEWNRRAFVARYLYAPEWNSSASQSNPVASAPCDIIPIREWLQKPSPSSRALVVAGFPGNLRDVLQTAALHTPQTGVILFDPVFESLSDAFANEDWREWILSPYVHWIVGESWRERLIRLLEAQGLLHLPPSTYFFVCEPSDEGRAQQRLIQETLASLARQAAMQYAQSLRASRPSRTGRALRIWAHTEEKAPVYSRLTETLMQGFRELGCEVHISHWGREWLTQEKIRTEWVNFSPDLSFFINGPATPIFRLLGMNEILLKSLNPKRLTWYIDQPRFLAPFAEAPWTCAEDDVAIVDRVYTDELQELRPRSLFHLPASTTLVRQGTVREEYRFPVMYVGSIRNIQPLLEGMPALQRDLLDHLLHLRLQMPSFNLQKFLEEIQPPLDRMHGLLQQAQQYNLTQLNGRFRTPEDALEYFLYVIATFRKRLDTAQALLPLGLHIFGPNDWLELVDPRYHAQVHGVISAQELADCYASADINLNIHSLQCPTCLNIRDYDVPYAGGFLLTDWVEECRGDAMVDEQHYRIYFSVEDLHEKVSYYLSHPQERCDIAQAGCRRVTERHLPIHRAERILRALFPEEKPAS